MSGRSILEWFHRRGRADGETRPAPLPAEFAEMQERFPPVPPRRPAVAPVAALDVIEQAFAPKPQRGEAPLQFESTGPQGHRGRLRDKLIHRGASALEDYELLEMLLFFAQPRGDTKPLAKRLINQFGSFAGVLTAANGELLAATGLGAHSVAAVRLVQAAATRLARAQLADQPVLNNHDRLHAYLRTVIGHEGVEHFRVLFLDSKNHLIADEEQGRGTINRTQVYPREIVKRALELRAGALILVHNHPSGDPQPSMPDIEMTEAVKQAAAALDIVVHDHVIVGRERNFSFHDEGLL